MMVNVKATIYSIISHNSILPPLCQQLVFGPFLFKHAKSQLHKQMVFLHFGLEELDRIAQDPDLSPIQHLWDELKHRL